MRMDFPKDTWLKVVSSSDPTMKGLVGQYTFTDDTDQIHWTGGPAIRPGDDTYRRLTPEEVIAYQTEVFGDRLKAEAIPTIKRWEKPIEATLEGAYFDKRFNTTIPVTLKVKWWPDGPDHRTVLGAPEVLTHEMSNMMFRDLHGIFEAGFAPNDLRKPYSVLAKMATQMNAKLNQLKE